MKRKVIWIVILFFFFSVSGFFASDIKDGIKLYKEKKYKEAKKVFLDIIKNDINNYTACFYLGLTSKNLGDYDNAVLAFQRATKLKPKNVSPYIELADIYLATGLFDLSEKYCFYALEKDKENARIYYILGQIYFHKGNYNKACLFFQNAIKYNSDNPYYYNYIGLAYLRLKEYNKANTAFLTATAMDNSVYFFYFNLGLSYEELKMWEKAKKSYEKCLKLEKDFENAKIRLKRVKRIIREMKLKKSRSKKK